MLRETGPKWLIRKLGKLKKKKCTHRDRSQTFQYGARDSGQSDLRFPTLKQVNLCIPWVPEVIFFRRGGEQELFRVEKDYIWSNEPATKNLTSTCFRGTNRARSAKSRKKNYLRSNEPETLLPHQTVFLGSQDVYFDSLWFGPREAAKSFDCDSEMGSSETPKK